MLNAVNRIREIREERAAMVPAAFTAVALSRRVGVSDKTLRSWEHGVSQPTARHARALARELGVTVADLRLDGATPDKAGDLVAERMRAERRRWASQSKASSPPPASPPGGRSSGRPMRP